MNSEPLTSNVRARICKHMNEDHQAALIQYAKRYGKVDEPIQSKMIDLTPLKIKLEVDSAIIEIFFDHKLIDSADAHRTLVAMIKDKSEDS